MNNGGVYMFKISYSDKTDERTSQLSKPFMVIAKASHK